MTGRLVGRVAVITGGASGIGEATVRRFVSEGARVVIADLQAELGQALAAELGDSTRFVRTDVTDEASLLAAITTATETFRALDIMFNNAGIIGATGPIATIGYDDYRRTMAVLVDSVVFGTKHAAAAMIAHGRGGSIISTSSVAAVSGGLGTHTYSAAKAAVLGFTQSVAAELWPHAIRANAILPGKIMTPMTANLRASATPVPSEATAPPTGPATTVPTTPSDSPESMRAERRAYPADIAAAALFLASDDARFVTGESLLVDGGLVRAGGPSPFAIGNYRTPGMIGGSVGS